MDGVSDVLPDGDQPTLSEHDTGFGTATTCEDVIAPLEEDHPLNEIDQATVSTDGAAGYTDYPELAPVS